MDALPSAPRRGRGRWPVIALTATLAALIGLIGSLAGPTWAPAHPPSPMALDSPEVTITDDAGARVVRPAEGTYETRRTELEIDLGPTTVPAWLFEPVGAPAGPGVVFIHGAGTVEPGAFEEQVQALTSAGIRTIVPAKRMDTYSTRERDYVEMAADYLASWRVLRDLPGVDRERVGIYGESEGAWIAPAAAASEPGVAFIILASAPVVSPREQAAYAAANYLHNTNVPRGLFRSIPRALGADIPGGGFEYIDFDVRPYYQRLHQPVLMVYGTGDASMPIEQGVQITRQNLSAGAPLTARYFEGADHGLTVDGVLAPGLTNVLTDWVWGLPRTASTSAPVAGAVPDQGFLAVPVASAPWYASGNLLVYSTLAAVALSLAGALLCAWSARRHGERGPVVRYSIAAVFAALATIAVFLGYVAQVARLAVNYDHNDLLVLGGWILVQVTALFAAGVAAVSLHSSYRARKRGIALSAATRAGVWSCHLGGLALLVVAAYWGAFPGPG